MAHRASRKSTKPVKRSAGTRGVLRLLGRVAVTALGGVLVALVGIQFARIGAQNLAMTRSLSAVGRDVQALRARKIAQQRELRRLSDPAGAIPEIHQRLHLVAPNEAIIYVKHDRPSEP